MNALHPNRDVKDADDALTSSGSTGTKDSRGCARIIANHREAAGRTAGRGSTAVLRAADWLSLAAAPTFAIMALLVRSSSEASPLSGMVFMYVLMAVFESVAWLKLMYSQRSSSRKE